MNVQNLDHLNMGGAILIELGNEVHFEIEQIDRRFKSILIGMKPGEYLIFELPRDAFSGNNKSIFFSGNSIIVRYLHDGTVFGFQSKIIDALSAPRKLLFIEHPKIIARYELRSKKRVDCFLPAKIEIMDKEKQGVLTNISEKGCRYQIKALKSEQLPSVQIDENLTLKFQFAGVEGEKPVSGKIKNIKKDEREMVLGIEFHEISPEVQNMINQYISNIEEPL